VLLLESAILAVAGGVLGLVLATWSIQLVPRLAPAYLPRLEDVEVNVAVMAFAIGVATLATFIAGLAPAFSAVRAGVAGAHHTRVTSGRTARRWREALIVGEVALALLLSIGTALLVRTFLELRPNEPGFEMANRIVARAQIPAEQIGTGQAIDFVRSLQSEIEAAHPGTRVAASTSIPLTGMSMLFPLAATDGTPVESPNGRAVMLHFRLTTPNYLDVLGVPIVRGRGITENDVAGAPQAVVINEAAARRLWPDETDVMGRTITLQIDTAAIVYTVVGLAADTRLMGAVADARPELWASYWQTPWAFVHIVVHAPPGTQVSGQTIRDVAATIDPTVAIHQMDTLESIAALSNASARFEMSLMIGFGALAFMLALVGCYSVLAHLVAQRRREIGVRMALGATRRRIVRLVVGRGLLLGGIGVTIGVFAALALTRILASRLYGVSATDPLTFSVAAAAMLFSAMLAALVPASRAAGVEPVSAIRGSD
jgi:predicted permease